MLKVNWILLFIIIIYSYGCSNLPKIHKKDFTNYEIINTEKFLNLLNEKESKGSYLGFGQIVLTRSTKQAFEITFENILFNENDSLLFIKGKLKSVFNNNSITNIQIVVLRKNENLIFDDDPEFIEYYNYIIPNDGEFATELKIINNKTKLLFGERPRYVNGEYTGTNINSMYVFDINKLLK